MSDIRKIELYDGNTHCGEVELNLIVGRSTLIIKYVDSEGRSGELSGHDFFYILSNLRKEYNNIGFKLLCKGALLNVFSGGLTSESSHGELAYQIDEYSGSKVVVDIFDGISDNEISDLALFDKQKEKRRAVIRKFSNRYI